MLAPQGPVALNPLKWVLGLSTMGSALKWDGDSKPANFYLVPRDPSKEIKVMAFRRRMVVVVLSSLS